MCAVLDMSSSLDEDSPSQQQQSQQAQQAQPQQQQQRSDAGGTHDALLTELRMVIKQTFAAMRGNVTDDQIKQLARADKLYRPATNSRGSSRPSLESCHPPAPAAAAAKDRAALATRSCDSAPTPKSRGRYFS